MPNKIHTSKPFFLLLFFSCLLLSCKTKKVIVDPAIEVSKKDILNKLLAPNHPEWVNAKAKARISSLYGTDKGQLYLRIKKDSVIWSAVKRLSIEGGRTLINSDSAFFINRLDKTWSDFSLDQLQKKYGLIPELTYLQNIMTGIAPQIDTTRYFKEEIDEDFYHVRSDIDGVMHSFKFDKRNGLLLSGKFETQYGIDGSWEFSDYRVCNNGMILPYKRIYHLKLNKEESLDLELEFSSIELDVPKSIKFEIPSHYIKI